MAELVHEKTGGNPFFAIQFLTALAEEGLLWLDPDGPAYIWDLARLLYWTVRRRVAVRRLPYSYHLRV